MFKFVRAESPEGAKDHRRGYHPRYCAPTTQKPCKGDRSFVPSALFLVGSNINGDYHPRLCSLQPFRLILLAPTINIIHGNS